MELLLLLLYIFLKNRNNQMKKIQKLELEKNIHFLKYNYDKYFNKYEKKIHLKVFLYEFYEKYFVRNMSKLYFLTHFLLCSLVINFGVKNIYIVLLDQLLIYSVLDNLIYCFWT